MRRRLMMLSSLVLVWLAFQAPPVSGSQFCENAYACTYFCSGDEEEICDQDDGENLADSGCILADADCTFWGGLPICISQGATTVVCEYEPRQVGE